MDIFDKIRRHRIRERMEADCKDSIEEKVNRYLDVAHQEIIGGHYFAQASSECICLYRDGYFIGAVMMSHAINEGIIKFIAERNKIEKHKADGTKTVADLIDEFREKNIVSSACADASIAIWKSFRADIHHMNPPVAKLDFQKLAQQNLKCLSTIEKEIFDFKVNNGSIVPCKPKYWDIKADGTTTAFLRLE